MITGSTRFQKYRFLLWKQYDKELKELQQHYENFKFYDDWIAYHYGPYSKKLDDDLQKCIENKLIIASGLETKHYSLTIRGRMRWRKLFNTSYDAAKEINDKIYNLQTYSLYSLLKLIYKAYPGYAEKSIIKDQLT